MRVQWIEVYRPHRNDPKGLVEAAKRKKGDPERRKGLDIRTWVVFDAESRAEQDARGYEQTINAAKRVGLKVANSSPSFEYWLLLYFSSGILVDSPVDAERELAKPERILGYRKPGLPYGKLWGLFKDGVPSEGAAARRSSLKAERQNVRLARPVTFVDELMDVLVGIHREE